MRFLSLVLVTGCAVTPVAPATVTQQAGLDRRMLEGTAQVRTMAQGHNAWLGVLHLSPAAKVPLHRDLSEEYLFVLEGGGTLWIDGEEHALAQGSAVFMPAGAEVRFENGPDPTTVIQVFAGPESAEKYASWAEDPSGTK